MEEHSLIFDEQGADRGKKTERLLQTEKKCLANTKIAVSLTGQRFWVAESRAGGKM